MSDIRQELMDTETRSDHLQRIAELSGGVSLGVRELPKLSSLVNDAAMITTLRSERPLWDRGFVALLVVGLLGAEWILRRKYDLP